MLLVTAVPMSFTAVKLRLSVFSALNYPQLQDFGQLLR